MPCIGLFMYVQGYAHEKGDAICFRPLDWIWGEGERNGDTFVLIKIPDMDDKDAMEYYGQCEFGDIKLKPKKKIRASKLNFDLLPKIEKGKILEVDINVLNNARVIKSETTNPFVVGLDPFDVGKKIK